MTLRRLNQIQKTTHFRNIIRNNNSAFFVFVAALLLLLCISGCDRKNLDMESEYQAVFLVNGQTFIGKLSGTGSDYPKLTDVFYIQSLVKPETKAVTNILVKRGMELHGPQFMYINAKNILVIEPVSPDSQVAKLIKEEKAKSPSTK